MSEATSPSTFSLPNRQDLALGRLSRRQSVETGIAAQVDVVAVADHGVEGARAKLEHDLARRDPQAVRAMTAQIGEVHDPADDRGRAGDAPARAILPLDVSRAGVERVERAVIGTHIYGRTAAGGIRDRRR